MTLRRSLATGKDSLIAVLFAFFSGDCTVASVFLVGVTLAFGLLGMAVIRQWSLRLRS